MEHFVEVCGKRGLKINAGKSKVMMLNGEEGLECEILVDGVRLDQFSESKYLGFVLDKSGTDVAECHGKVANERKVAGDIKSLINSRGQHLQCARLLHCSCLFC